MSKRVKVDLTEREAETLTELLGMVLGNGDQWSFMDLGALCRIDNKVNDQRHVIPPAEGRS